MKSDLKKESKHNIKVMRKVKRISYLKVAVLFTSVFVFVILAINISHFSYESMQKVSIYIKNKTQKMREDKNLSDLKELEIVRLSSETYTQDDIVAKVKKQVVLPAEEVNMMVKVKNAKQLRASSPLFVNAKEDDYILVYPSAAIIYDAKAQLVVKYISLN
jgi:hypothetical protein